MASDPTVEEINEFKFITNIHMLLVKNMGKMLNDKDYSVHDKSKFEPSEIRAYTLKFIRHLPNAENPEWHDAVNHHYQNNDHHAQYWSYHKREMPRDCIEEAVVDMMCAKLQYQLYPKLEELVRIQPYDIDENKLIEILKEKLLMEELYVFQSKFLEPYTDDDKLTINKILNRHKMKMLNT